MLTTWKADLGGTEDQPHDRGRAHRPEGPADGRLAGDAEGLSKEPAGPHREGEAKPDQTAALDAQTFLTTAQLRLSDYREAHAQEQGGRDRYDTAKAAYDTYCSVLEEELNALYDEVEKDFSTFYRAINEDDESTFTAKLTPSEGKLDLRGQFLRARPVPARRVSQRRASGRHGRLPVPRAHEASVRERFTFALLDDVVMSVDAGHRYQFCKLLKTQFPDTQFIITTHDRLWAEQMKSAGLVTGRRSLAFHSWTIDTGPLVESNQEIWDEIAASLAKGQGRGGRGGAAPSS